MYRNISDQGFIFKMFQILTIVTSFLFYPEKNLKIRKFYPIPSSHLFIVSASLQWRQLSLPEKLGTDLSNRVAAFVFEGELSKIVLSSGAGQGWGMPGRQRHVNRSRSGRHSASPHGLASHACPQLPTFTPPKASARIPICANVIALLMTINTAATACHDE